MILGIPSGFQSQWLFRHHQDECPIFSIPDAPGLTGLKVLDQESLGRIFSRAILVHENNFMSATRPAAPD